ncbi:major facilitator superfamily transporter [Colletotrichum orchidophilum]|uniref:Major facilitator superfamily transporter n=1 Tax=Colletotrichum orchidophilum TaxID=1209926 RepID=A0A1G4BPJ5_9PEZI|nr:major facilitator superfamily transporter [Colletotrichum orchidophilum]OHF03390.1 major facilitator superfamily transporter [Colletotrichum orchidophilum]
MSGPREKELHRARLVASVAATVISLACGTNYVYSAWSPQFAERLKLSSTETNVIGLSANLGMYSLGVPVGMLVDHKGPRSAVIIGSVLLALGYFPFHIAYDRAAGPVPLLCFFSYLSGLGGCLAFAASVKTSALNWPHHRGTATAFPLAAFGLSAFFFSTFGSIFFPGNTSAFLALLSIGTCGLTFLGFFFLRVYPHAIYHNLPASDGLSGPQQLRRTSSEEAKPNRPGHGHRGTLVEPGTSPKLANTTTTINSTADYEPVHPEYESSAPSREADEAQIEAVDADDYEPDETSSLVSTSSSMPGDVFVQSSVDLDRSHRVDIRGWALLREVDFWQFFLIMGILTGIGLMTINNIGNDVKALWRHWDESVDEAYLITKQQMHVSILSIGSFAGRLLSGVGSDFIVKVLHGSRVWCLVASSLVFFVAQLMALHVTNPHLLGLVSGLSGIAYGFLFGVFPSIVAETFGIHGLSQNWGLMTLSPVVSGNVFNIFYGRIYDRHSVVGPDGERVCHDGLDCYRAAYLMTLGACSIGLVLTLWVIRHQRVKWAKEEKSKAEQDD